ncbi:hypothetical protein O4J56_26935 [Nocardiopsis sp. RSe5-2]|uniref:PH domain-containing protein n=1 Tax=Nocardiopsis endophytica TaxID=3018445 RepID=A0ABT4UBQ2_9ACTN|nr:hypothetical protein [Nocardiopsis endophytica]MDA2814312.1 hypothetical protein [Nocardiopsis endophytica]
MPLGRAKPRRSNFAVFVVMFTLWITAQLLEAQDDPGARAALAAPWQAPLPAFLALACLGLIAGGMVVASVAALPSVLARCSVTVGPVGLEITEHTKLWRRGRTTRVPWEAVRLAVSREAPFRAGRYSTGMRPVFELFVDRPFENLPDFAACREAGVGDSRDPYGRPVAPYLLRIGAISASRIGGVRHVADLAAHYRRDLFHPAPGTTVGESDIWLVKGWLVEALFLIGALILGMVATGVFHASV